MQTSVLIAKDVCRILANTCVNVTENKIKYCEAGGCEGVVAALRSPLAETSVSLTGQVCRAVFVLSSNEECASRLGQAGACAGE